MTVDIKAYVLSNYDKMSYRSMSDELYVKYDVWVSEQTLQKMLKDMGIQKPVVPGKSRNDLKGNKNDRKRHIGSGISSYISFNDKCKRTSGNDF